jgi:hypothetical protein
MKNINTRRDNISQRTVVLEATPATIVKDKVIGTLIAGCEKITSNLTDLTQTLIPMTIAFD